MSIPYDKPFLTVHEQLDLLRSRGMKVEDDELALRALRTVGYYNLSGYWHPMRNWSGPDRKARTDDFMPGSSFDQVLNLYAFDCKLRTLTFERIEGFEQALRVQIALAIGEVSSTGHLEAESLSDRFSTDKVRGETQFARWQRLHEEGMRKARRKPFLEHFRAKYEPPMPIWMSIETWDYGQTRSLLLGLRRRELKKVTSAFDLPREREFTAWANTIGIVRNECAHHGRLWNLNLAVSPSPLPDSLLAGAAVGKRTWHRIYGVLLFLLRVDSTLLANSSSWPQRVGELLDEFPSAPGVGIGAMGVPPDWRRTWRRP